MQEHQLRVERTARYYLLGSPGNHVRRLWVALHGYGQLASSLLRRCETLVRADTLVVAPEALSRFYLAPVSPAAHRDAQVGASWMTREARESEIADYVAYLDRLHAELIRECGGNELETRVLGFSQGAATAVRWALLGQSGPPPRQLLVWAGGLPQEMWTDAARARLANTEIVLAAGDADPYVSAEDFDRIVERLETAGYRPRAFPFVGGHTVTREALARAVGAETS
jgi:predicted esterase